MLRLRDARVEALLGTADPARRRRPTILERARLRRGATADDGLDVTVPALAPQRRHARGRPDRGGRADLGAGEAAGHAALAARRERAGSTPEQRLRRRAEDALVGAGLSRGDRLELPGARRWSTGCAPGRRPAPRVVRCATRCPRTSRCMRTTLLGSLLDVAARATARAGSRTCGCSRTARSTSTRARDGGASCAAAEPRPRAGLDRCRTSARTSPRCSPAACGRRRWREPEPAAGRLLRRQGACSTALLRRAARARGRSSAGARAVPAPGPRARGCWSAASRRGWLGELHPAVAARVGPRAASPGFELDLGVLAARRRAAPRYEDLTSFPAVRQDLAVVVPGRRRRRRERASRSSARRAARCCARAEVFDVYRGAQVGEGRASLAAAARVPRARPHADRRGGRRAARRRSSPRWPSSSGGELRG